MNDNQKAVLFIVAGVIVLMLLFPPVARYNSYSGALISVSYEFILSTSKSVQLGRLIVQWLAVCLVGGILFYALKDSKNEDGEK